MDVVEYVASLLENDPLFNAGYGAVYNSHGMHELEASIMDGSTKRSGAVMSMKTMRNPIKVARQVLDRSHHCVLAGEAACDFGAANGCEVVENNYFGTKRRRFQLKTMKAESLINGVGDIVQNSEDTSIVHESTDDWNEEELKSFSAQQETNQRTGTIGVVAQYKGSTAAATSTGGMTNKHPGRVGDSALIGCGTYADNATCAVSCTGVGELFIRHTVSSTIAHRMRFGDETLESAVSNTIFNDLPAEAGGVIAVDLAGNATMKYNTMGMYRAQCRYSTGATAADVGSANECLVAIWDDEVHFTL